MVSKNYIVLFLSVMITFFFSIFVYIPILPGYAQNLGSTTVMIGIISGSYGLFQIFFRIPLGILSDKLRKKKSIINLGIAISVLSCTVFYFADGFWGLLLGRLLAGAAMVTWVIMIALFAGYYPKEETSKAMGILMAVSFIGQMLGNYIGGISFEILGPKYPFILGIISASVSFVLSLFIKDIRMEKNVNAFKLEKIFRITENKTVFSSSLLGLTLHYILFATAFAFTPVLAKAIGADGSQIGFIVFLFSLSSIAGSLTIGSKFADGFRGKKSIIFSFILIGVSCAFTPLLTNVYQFYIMSIISGFGRGIAFAVLSSLSIKHVGSEQTATATGLFQTFVAVGILSGPIITGLLVKSISYSGSYITLVLVAFISIAISAKWIPEECKILKGD
jgi:MFS family permease